MYTKNKWAIYNPEIPDNEQPGAFITLSKLNNIESGIEGAHNELAEVRKIAESASGGTANIEIGEVVEGESAAAEIVDGKLNLTLPKGPQGEAGAQGPEGPQGEKGAKGNKGDKGDTPVKGEDYFTEEDKNEIVEAVLATQKNTPYFDEEANVVAACGMHINVEAAEEPGKLRIYWLADSKENELIVPEGVRVVGGGLSADRIEYYPATSVTLNSGYVDALIGGCYGNGIVGHATVIVNGGTFNGKDTYVSGGGTHWADKKADKNKVGHAEVIINGTSDEEISTVYCGAMSGLCSTGHGTVTVNGGKISWVSGGGSNGYTSISEIIINDGEVKVVQGCNRGFAGNVKTTVNGGTIKNLYAGGEAGDSSVTAVYDKVELFINGGNINKLAAGTNGGVEDATKVSGKYVEGVVADDVAVALNLVKTSTIEKLMEKIAALEAK